MRKKLNLLLSFSFFTVLLFAQTAPNFDLTTTSGDNIKLYESYLNKGQTVVIEIFFVSCPPCRQLAPHMSALYKDLKSREVAVEFISLSTNRDADEEINGFKVDFSHPWPFVGDTGGSREALRVYQDGTFGQYWGTPTTIVIAPDGTVNYNVRGSINNGEWTENLEQAIIDSQTAYNENNMPATAVVSGGVTSISGNGISGVEVVIIGTNDTTIVSDDNGNFATAGLLVDGNYTVAPQKTDAAVSGVTTADIIRISQHILGIAPFTDNFQGMAADVNNSGTVTTFDLVQIRQLILGIFSEFPGGHSWSFEPAAASINFLGEGGLNNLNFTGIKKGDANGSANLLQAEDRNKKEKISFHILNRPFKRGELVEVPLIAENMATLKGFQFTLNFNPAVLTLLEVKNFQLEDLTLANFNLSNKTKGWLTTSWNSVAKQLNKELFTLQFRANSDGNLKDYLRMNSAITKAEAYNQVAEILDLYLSFKNGESPTKTPLQAYPNPVHDGSLFLDFENENPEEINLFINDLNGKLVQTNRVLLTEKYQKQVRLNIQNLPNGIYIIQLDTGNGVEQNLRFVKQ